MRSQFNTQKNWIFVGILIQKHQTYFGSTMPLILKPVLVTITESGISIFYTYTRFDLSRTPNVKVNIRK